MTDHTPPQDLDAETAVLGSAMMSPAALDEVAPIVQPHHFWKPAHETIYSAILDLASKGQPADAITVGDHLTKTGDLERIGGITYLWTLTGNVVTPTNATYHAAIIRDAHTIRTVQTTGQTIAGLTAEHTLDGALEAVDTARSHLDALVAGRTTKVPHAQAVWDAIEALDQPVGIPTPWPDLTDAIAGWRPGALYVIGARPGVGKTIVGANITLDAARQGTKALYVSLEMSSDELYHRILSDVGSVSMGKITKRQLTDHDHKALAVAAAEVEPLNIEIEERAELSVGQIRAEVRRLQREGHTLGPVVVDYLGLIKAPPGNDRRVQVDAIVRSLKNLAKELHVPVIALAQLNRNLESRADKAPMLSDLRESGEIEQAADVVMLLHRDLDAHDPTDMHVIVAKNRHGPRTQIRLALIGHYSRAIGAEWKPSTNHAKEAS